MVDPSVKRCERLRDGVGAGSIAPSVEDRGELTCSGRRDAPSVEERGVDRGGESG